MWVKCLSVISRENCLAERFAVLLSPTAKIAVIKPSCTVQYEVLDTELCGGVCQDPETTINWSAQYVYVYIWLLDFTQLIDTLLTENSLLLYCSCFLCLFVSSRVREKLTNACMSLRRVIYIYIYIYNLVYITCAHVWGGRPVPKINSS